MSKGRIVLVLFCLLMMTLLISTSMAQQETATPVAAQAAEKSLVDIAPDEIPANVVKVLRTTNKAQINNYVAKVYDFKNVNPYEIVNFIANGLEVEEGGIYTFVHPDGNKGKMLVICPKYQLPWLDKVCQQLDRPNLTAASGSKRLYYRLKDRSAADLPFLTVLRNYVSAGGTIFPDIETNSVLLYDAPGAVDYCENALDKYLDAPTPQVNIDVKIYEIALRNDGTLGLDYEMWKNAPGQNLFAVQFTGKYVTSRYNNIAFGRPPFEGTLPPALGGTIPEHLRYRDWYRGYGYRLEYPSAFFDFLVEKGKAKILIDTKLSTSNANSAMIRTGDFIPYFTVANVQSGALYSADLSQSPPVVTGYNSGDVKFSRKVSSSQQPLRVEALPELGIHLVDTGVGLAIIPVVGREEINLELTAKVVNHLGWASNGEPLLSSFQIANEFRVKNDEQILIGGLTRERLSKATKKIPLLGSLPVIGWLFGGETDYLQKSILVVALRPHVITDFSGATVADKETMDKALGVKPTKIPVAKVGFDQLLLDGEK